MTATIHDARKFCLDLIKELRRLRSPQYPQPEWHRALERADNADQAREVASRNSTEDADYYEHQHRYEMLESDRDPDPRFLGRPYSARRAYTARVARAEAAISCP